MKVKSLLVAGTMVAGLGVSVFSLPMYAAGTTINGIADMTCADDGMGATACVLPSGSYELGSDIDLGELSYIAFKDGVEVTLNLNGHSITSANYQTIAVNDATVIINGDGTVNGSTHINDEANVTINGGTFLAEGPSAVYASSYVNPLTLTINGGTFDSEFDFGIQIEDMVGSTIVFKGGTFKGGAGSVAIEGTRDDLLALAADGYSFSGDNIEDNSATLGTSILLTSPVTVQADSVEEDEEEPETPTTPAETPTTPTGDKVKAMEEMSREMEKMVAETSTEKVIARATSKGSTKKTTTKVKAPNTGAVAK